MPDHKIILDFAPELQTKKALAYAASLGGDRQIDVIDTGFVAMKSHDGAWKIIDTMDQHMWAANGIIIVPALEKLLAIGKSIGPSACDAVINHIIAAHESSDNKRTFILTGDCHLLHDVFEKNAPPAWAALKKVVPIETAEPARTGPAAPWYKTIKNNLKKFRL